MRSWSHLAFSLVFALLFYNIVSANAIVFFALVLFGALLPDIDTMHSTINKRLPFLKIVALFCKHRRFFHSIFPPAIAGIVLWIVAGFASGFALFLGYGSHLVADSFTVTGVRPFFPLSRFHPKGPIHTGSITEILFFIGTAVLIVLLLVF